MRNHAAPAKSRKKNGTLASALPVFGQPNVKDKPCHTPQETEGYIDLFYDSRIAPRVQHCAADGHKGPYINLIRQVARDMYTDEDEETRAAVRAHLAAQTEEREAETKALAEAEGASQPTPQQYQQ